MSEGGKGPSEVFLGAWELFARQGQGRPGAANPVLSVY